MTHMGASALRRTRPLQLQFFLTLPERAQPERVESDKTGRVAVVIGDRPLLEGDQVLVVKRVGTFAADHDGVAFIELEPHFATDELLTAINRGLKHFALWCEPEAVVYELCIFRHQLVLEMHGAAVERNRLNATMGRMQDGAARRL